MTYDMILCFLWVFLSVLMEEKKREKEEENEGEKVAEKKWLGVFLLRFFFLVSRASAWEMRLPTPVFGRFCSVLLF